VLIYLTYGMSFVLAMMLQYGVFSRWMILSGSPDLVLLLVIALCLHQKHRRFWILILIMGGIVGFVSALPFFLPMVVYMAVYLASLSLKQRVLQTPLLAMFLLTFSATILANLLSIAVLFVQRIPFDFTQALVNVVLPAVFLNMFLAIPVHAIVRELSVWLYPQGAQV
jgi:cell shape-determining protein MreD